MSNHYNKLLAQEAYEITVRKLDEVDISDSLESVLSRIRSSAEQGSLACWSDSMDFLMAEKLALALEEMGYTCSPQPSNNIVEGRRQALIAINWKYIANNTRERLST